MEGAVIPREEPLVEEMAAEEEGAVDHPRRMADEAVHPASVPRGVGPAFSAPRPDRSLRERKPYDKGESDCAADLPHGRSFPPRKPTRAYVV